MQKHLNTLKIGWLRNVLETFYLINNKVYKETVAKPQYYRSLAAVIMTFCYKFNDRMNHRYYIMLIGSVSRSSLNHSSELLL